MRCLGTSRYVWRDLGALVLILVLVLSWLLVKGSSADLLLLAMACGCADRTAATTRVEHAESDTALLPLGTVQMRAFHAMRALRAALVRRGFDPTT